MTPEIDRFTALATRALEARPDLRDEAVTELLERIGHQGVPLDQIDLSAPLARLEAVAPARPWKRRLALAAGTLAIVAVAILGAGRDLLDAMSLDFIESLRYRSLLDPVEARILQERDPLESWFEDQLIAHAFRGSQDPPLTGVPGDGETGRLRRFYPEDLGVLQEHLARRSMHAPEFMTAEERALVTKLDPDNALWPLMEIRWLDLQLSGGGPSHAHLRHLEISMECYRLVSEAASKPHLTNHAGGMVERQKASLPACHGILDVMRAEALTRLVLDGTAGYYDYRGSPGRWLLECRKELASKGDREVFEELWQDVLAVQRLRAREPASVVFGISGMDPFMSQVRATLYPELGRAGIPPDFPSFIYYRPASAIHEDSVFLQNYGRMLPADLTAGEVRPLRLAETAMFTRFLLWLGCGVMVLVVVLALIDSIRRSRRTKGLARGLMPLLTWRDHAWIAGLGILLPWLWYLGVRFSPLGSESMTRSDESLAMVTMQATLALVLAILMVVQTAQWRWSVRGGFLGLGRGMRIIGWLAAAVTALAMVAMGCMPFVEFTRNDAEEMYLLGCAGAGSIGLLGLLWVAISHLFTGGRAALGPNLVSRTSLLWMLALFATLVLAAGILIGVERHWVARETLLAPGTSRHFAHALEERACLHQCERIIDWLRAF
ncbi:MAG: hypothetical protein RLZ97_614 [Verrucomicrobiota bacterium]